jgi:hypothetical protein
MTAMLLDGLRSEVISTKEICVTTKEGRTCQFPLSGEIEHGTVIALEAPDVVAVCNTLACLGKAYWVDWSYLNDKGVWEVFSKDRETKWTVTGETAIRANFAKALTE